MRITIETTEAERRAVSFHPVMEQAAVPAVADADGGSPSETLLLALGGAATAVAAPGNGKNGSTDAGGPPAWLAEMISSLRRPLP